MKEQTVFRRAKDRDNPFVMIDKELLELPALSWKAKGLLAYLLSRPDDWEVWLNDLVKRSIDGEHATKSGLRELERTGYLTRHRQRGKNGQFAGYLILVHEIPVPPEDRTVRQICPQGEKPLVDNPLVDNPQVENHLVTNTDLTNTDLTNTPPDFSFSDPSPEPKEKPKPHETLRQRLGNPTDPIALSMALSAEDNSDRPTGWEHTPDATFAVCQRVADLWMRGIIPSGTYGDRVEKWTAGAAELLRYHKDDLQAALLTLDRYHLHYEDQGLTFSVAGPQSLLGVIPSFMAGGARKQKVGGRRERSQRKGRREYEPCTDVERKIAWNSHGDALLAWIEERGTDANLSICGPAIAKSLGLGDGTVQALLEA